MAEHKAVIKQISGVTFAGRTEDSNHWVMMDGPEDFGGSNAAIRPKELLLLSLGGCSGSDVAVILKKKRVHVDDFQMNVTAESTETHPRVYSKINVEYVFTGKNIREKDVERAIQLSEDTYCGVRAMLKNTVEITHSYRIIESE